MKIADFEFEYQIYIYDNYGIISNYISDGDVFIDVGANTGLLSKKIYDTTKLNKIYLIEPVPYLAEECKRKFKNYENVEIHQLALSNSNKEETMYVSHWNLGYNKIFKEGMEIHPHDELKINCITFSDWVLLNKINKIDFIKIDAEGHDIEIVEGMFKWLDSIENKPYILFEGNWYIKEERALITEMKNLYNYDCETFGRDILLIPNNKKVIKNMI
jgi:FkbM family methyltransferase